MNAGRPVAGSSRWWAGRPSRVEPAAPADAARRDARRRRARTCAAASPPNGLATSSRALRAAEAQVAGAVDGEAAVIRRARSPAGRRTGPWRSRRCRGATPGGRRDLPAVDLELAPAALRARRRRAGAPAPSAQREPRAAAAPEVAERSRRPRSRPAAWRRRARRWPPRPRGRPRAGAPWSRSPGPPRAGRRSGARARCRVRKRLNRTCQFSQPAAGVRHGLGGLVAGPDAAARAEAVECHAGVAQRSPLARHQPGARAARRRAARPRAPASRNQALPASVPCSSAWRCRGPRPAR